MKQRAITSFEFGKKSHQQIFLVAIAALWLLAIGKDLLHSFIKDYHFYLSDSMLFGTFWLLFVPLAWMNRRVWRPGGRPFAVMLPLLFSLLHIVLFSLIVFSVSALFFSNTFGFVRIFTDTLAENGISCLLVYAAVNFIFGSIEQRESRPQKARGMIRVKQQDKVYLLDPEEILYVKTERPYIALVTGQRTYLYHSSLKRFKKEQLPDNFIRIHKSTVINTRFIESFQSRQNGDYDLLMSNGDRLRVSRNYNRYFKSGA